MTTDLQTLPAPQKEHRRRRKPTRPAAAQTVRESRGTQAVQPKHRTKALGKHALLIVAGPSS